jgi:hypothetical protein
VRAALVLGPHVEQFVNVEQIFERVGAVEELAVLPEAREHGPESETV